jgi:AP endonuclease-1
MRKKLSKPESDSSLSPVADDLIVQVESEIATKPATNSKKRKAHTTDVKVTTRTKKAKGTGTTEKDMATSADGISIQKRRSAKKIRSEEEMVHDEFVVQEDGDDKAKVTTKKTTTRRKKQADLAPVAERTRDTNLRVGAHVSTAGG